MESSALTALIAALGSGVSGCVGAYLNHLYNQRKAKIEEAKNSIDDGVALRRDLLEERKTLLQQLLDERNFYTSRLNAVEESYDSRIAAMESRIQTLEESNHKKDETILAQQRKIDEQALQIHSQQALIETLQQEVKELKHVTESSHPQPPTA